MVLKAGPIKPPPTCSSMTWPACWSNEGSVAGAEAEAEDGRRLGARDRQKMLYRTLYVMRRAWTLSL